MIFSLQHGSALKCINCHLTIRLLNIQYSLMSPLLIRLYCMFSCMYVHVESFSVESLGMMSVL